MRISIVGPVYPYRGGIAHYTTILTRELRRLEHEVLLISFKRQYPNWLYPGRSNKDPSQLIFNVDDTKFWIDSINPLTWIYSFIQINRFKPGLILLQWWTPFWAPVWTLLGVLNQLFLKVPLLFVCHNVLPHESRFYDKWITRLVLHQGNYFIVHSEAEKELFKKLFPSKIPKVVPLPVFDMFLGKRIGKKKARSILNLPSKANVLLFFGIVRKYKGLMDLLSALAHVRNHIDNVFLVVAGEFWDDKRSYLDTIKELKIEENVIIHDYYIPNEKVGLFFAAADLLVAPYRSVTGSAVVQMARGVGLPVVMPRILNSNDLTNHGDERNSIVNDLVLNILNALKHGDLLIPDNETDFMSWSNLVSAIESIYINAKK